MSAQTEPPLYKGEPLDSDRGPGLGCFWIQIALLTFFLILTPLTVTWAWDPRVSAILLIFTLILLLFSGQTIIFLLRLVAADRRTRRTPLDPAARPTVGQMEDVSPRTADAATSESDAAPDTADAFGESEAREGPNGSDGLEQPEASAGSAEPEEPEESAAPGEPTGGRSRDDG